MHLWIFRINDGDRINGDYLRLTSLTLSLLYLSNIRKRAAFSHLCQKRVSTSHNPMRFLFQHIKKTKGSQVKFLSAGCFDLLSAALAKSPGQTGSPCHEILHDWNPREPTYVRRSEVNCTLIFIAIVFVHSWFAQRFVGGKQVGSEPVQY